MIEKISQSFMKDVRAYNAGEECGNIMHHKYVLGKLIDNQSKAMAEGSYFEFLLSGGLPKNGKVPVAIMQKSGKEMLMEYKRATVNAARVKKMLQVDMGLKFIAVGRKIAKGRFEGTLDLIVECTKRIEFINGTVWEIGYRFVIDVKYSGLLWDKWEKHGWVFDKEIQKEYHGTQALQYNLISGLDFYFLVVGNTNKEQEDEITGKKEFAPTDIRLIHVPITEQMTERHISDGNNLMESFKLSVELGLVPKPSLKACSECPLKAECKDKVLFPQIEVVDINLN